MPSNLLPSAPMRIAYLAHTLRSDWNNGNAHFLRGLLSALGTMGHDATGFEPETEWSLENLRTEPRGAASLAQFAEVYPDLTIRTYGRGETDQTWAERLAGVDVVILHEWNPPALAQTLLRLRARVGYKLLFHDTHHRASSSPDSFAEFGLGGFDGVLAFGEALRTIYRERFGIERVWTLHEAADTRVFTPQPGLPDQQEIVWVGNWGEGERAAELHEYLLGPAARLAGGARTTVYGVRYPEDGLAALGNAGIAYGGYLPNLAAPTVYAQSRLTLHVPRQQYSGVMTGIPTIRVFEALACGIPLISAPWQDTEGLFRPGDFRFVENGEEMLAALKLLLGSPEEAAAQAKRGRATVLARHTCLHRAQELTAIFEELQ